MKRSSVALLCGFLGTLATAVTIPSQVTGQAEIPTEKLVYALRLLNTEEYSYRHETGRFASRDELLTFLRTKGLLSESPTDLAKPKARFVFREEMSTSLPTNKPLSDSPIDLENPKPYELRVTTSLDGMHYQITLKRLSDMNDKNSWCRTAAFSDDAGLIFLGSVIDCEASAR